MLIIKHNHTKSKVEVFETLYITLGKRFKPCILQKPFGADRQVVCAMAINFY